MITFWGPAWIGVIGWHNIPVHDWLLSYEAPFEDNIYPGCGACFPVSVIVYGMDEIQAHDAMTPFYFAQDVCVIVLCVGKVQGRGCR